MKKTIIWVCLFSLFFLAGCTIKRLSETSDVRPESEANAGTTTAELASLLEKRELIRVLEDYQGLQTFQDNFIGNLTANLSAEMTPEVTAELRTYLDEFYIPVRGELVKRHEEADQDLDDLNLNTTALATFRASNEVLLRQLNAWSNGLVHFSPDTVPEFLADLRKGQAAYLAQSDQAGKDLLTLLTTGTGLSEDEASELARQIVIGALEKYGDPADVAAIKKQHQPQN